MYDSEILSLIFKAYESAKNEHFQNQMDSITKISPYSSEINNAVFTLREIELYKEWGLTEANITRTVLIAEIDPNFNDINGKSNLEKMLKGLPPIDKFTGEIYVLHHIGQNYESPFAEIPKNLHSRTYYSVLHKKHIDSWRSDSQLINLTRAEFNNHWVLRGKQYL